MYNFSMFEQIIKAVGLIIGTFFFANALDIFIVGLQFPIFSVKWWALYVLCGLIIFVILEALKDRKTPSI